MKLKRNLVYLCVQFSRISVGRSIDSTSSILVGQFAPWITQYTQAHQSDRMEDALYIISYVTSIPPFAPSRRIQHCSCRLQVPLGTRYYHSSQVSPRICFAYVSISKDRRPAATLESTTSRIKIKRQRIFLDSTNESFTLQLFVDLCGCCYQQYQERQRQRLLLNYCIADKRLQQ